MKMLHRRIRIKARSSRRGVQISLWFGLVLFALSSICFGFDIIQHSLQRLVQKSDAIVQGHVIDSRIYKKEITADSNIGLVQFSWVLTDYTLAVDRVFKGTGLDKKLVITSYGGDDGQLLRQWQTGSFTLEEGEEVLIFAIYDHRNKLWTGFGERAGVFTPQVKGGYTELKLWAGQKADKAQNDSSNPPDDTDTQAPPDFTIERLEEILKEYQ